MSAKAHAKQTERWLDIALLVVPWLCAGWTCLWGASLGPNARPPWPIGDRISYEASLDFQFWLFTTGFPVLVGIRYFIRRRRFTLATCTIASSIIAGIVVRALEFA